MNMEYKCIFISGACEQTRIWLLKNVISWVYLKNKLTKLKLIDSNFKKDYWQIDSIKEPTFYTGFFDQAFLAPGKLEISGKMTEMSNIVAKRMELFARNRKLNTLPNLEMSTDLWVVSNADKITQKYFEDYPKNGKIKITSPILYCLKLKNVVNITAIVSGESPFLENYGVRLIDLDNFDIAIWLRAENIKKMMSKISYSSQNLKRALGSQLNDMIKEGDYVDKNIALVHLREEQPYITKITSLISEIAINNNCCA